MTAKNFSFSPSNRRGLGVCPPPILRHMQAVILCAMLANPYSSFMHEVHEWSCRYFLPHSACPSPVQAAQKIDFCSNASNISTGTSIRCTRWNDSEWSTAPSSVGGKNAENASAHARRDHPNTTRHGNHNHSMHLARWRHREAKNASAIVADAADHQLAERRKVTI